MGERILERAEGEPGNEEREAANVRCGFFSSVEEESVEEREAN